ncbi:MAG: T9SS type A sorting domain-containing protein [Ignavibacteria bacterium]
MKKILILAFLALCLFFNSNKQIRSEIIPITKSISPKHLPASIKSKAGIIDDGTIICWVDAANGGSIRIQKLGLDGLLKWTDNGISIDSSIGPVFNPDTDYPMLYSDNLGGALVIYVKTFSSSREIYFAKVYSDGSMMNSPLPLSTIRNNYCYSPASVLTNDNTVAVCWESFNDDNFDIHAQKIDLDGNIIWNNGKEKIVCAELHDQRKPTITCDGYNSIFICWLDERFSGNYPEFTLDLFADRINVDGNLAYDKSRGKLVHSNYGIKMKNFESNMQNQTGTYKRSESNTDNRKFSFYNHNIISSHNNSVIIALDQWDRDQDSFIKIFKLDKNLDMVWMHIVDEISYQFKPLITGDNTNTYVFWNDQRNNEHSVYGIGFGPNGNITMGGEKGMKVSCDKMKNTFIRTLPSERNQQGVSSGTGNIQLSWVTSEYNELVVSTINPLNKNIPCGENSFTLSNVTEGEYTSITSQAGNTVVVFKQSENIVAWRASKNKKSVDFSQKISSNNFPNPFNPETIIHYDLPKDGFSKLTVYDITGKLISTLVNQYKTAGTYNVIFNGSVLPSGIYFYRIESNGFSDTKKMTLVK